MSAIKVDTNNLSILSHDVANSLAEKKRYEEYGREVIEKIASEVVDRYKKAIASGKGKNEVIVDDEELFDETYDYMLKKLKEVFSTADIAYIVNDVFIEIEDLLFDEGILQYHS